MPQARRSRIILYIILITLQEHTDYNESEILYGKHELTQLLKVHNRLPIRPEGYMCLRCNASSAWATNIPCTREMYAIIGGKVIPISTGFLRVVSEISKSKGGRVFHIRMTLLK